MLKGILVTWFLISGICYAQDLNEKKNIFLTVRTNRSQMETNEVAFNIKKEISKKNKDFKFVENIEQAEIILEFEANAETLESGIISQINCRPSFLNENKIKCNSTEQAQIETVVNSIGCISIVNNGKLEVLDYFKDTKSSNLESRPSTNFAKYFLKLYKRNR